MARSCAASCCTLLAEISQHAGHADIIREAIDGQRTLG
ncbi:MAG: DUF664 domain-containing protein [Phycicoccus sp.]|nr:DUF664 domain-containing protein [Phycicoccus sp.]